MLCFKGTLGNFETVIDMRVAYHFHRAKTNCCSNRLTYYGYVLSDLLASHTNTKPFKYLKDDFLSQQLADHFATNARCGNQN